jgi:acyl-CoA hydrolase
MDEVAYITATRFTRKRMFTLSIEKIKFLKQIHPDTIIEIIGRIERVTDIRLFIKVEIFAEEMYDSNKEKKIEGIFEFVALDAHQKPERLLHNKLVL